MELIRLEKPLYIKKKTLFKPDLVSSTKVHGGQSPKQGFGSDEKEEKKEKKVQKTESSDSEFDSDSDSDSGSESSGSDVYEEVEEDPDVKVVIKTIYDKMTYMEKKQYEEKNKLYNLARQTYNDIYNSCNARGTTKLKAVSMMGKPIQLDSNNLETLSRHKYSVSTKADGYRFFMMISNDMNKNRTLFFVDSNLDFWILKKNNMIINNITGIDKCLVDGELYMHGFKYENTEHVTRYVSNPKDEKACAFFIAFDILYGPMCPKFEDEKNEDETNPAKKKNVIGNNLEPGPSAPMVGFKATTRWPTQNRRTVLENVFNNDRSPIINQLKEISKIMNFTIMVSPFVDLDYIIQNSPKLKDDESFNYYEYMKHVFKSSLEYQFKRNTNKNTEDSNLIDKLTKSSDLGDSESTYILATVYMNKKEYSKAINLLQKLTQINYSKYAENDVTGKLKECKKNKKNEVVAEPKKFMPDIKTDGLIFTPSYMPYVYDTWSACNNKQYKWKPKSHLTIDFAISSSQKIGDDYIALVSIVKKDNKGLKIAKGGKGQDADEPVYMPKDFVYEEKQAIVKGNPEIENILKKRKYIVVECNKKTMLLNNDKYHYFTILKLREDKEKPNSYKTAISVLDANKLSGDIINNLILLKNPTSKNYRKYLENVINFLNKESIIKLFFKSDIYKLLNETQYKNLKYMINQVKNNGPNGIAEYMNQVRGISPTADKVLELETRIVFHSNCSFYLLKDTIGVTTIPTTTYRYHSTIDNQDARLTCLDVADQIIPYSINFKKELNKMPITGIKNYFKDIKSFNIVLASEEEKELNVESENMIKANVGSNGINYQSRVFISNLSVFWEVEIIEYTSADSPEKAKEYYQSGPRKVLSWKDKSTKEKDNGYMTRIEIEYKPLAILTNFLNVYKINYEENNVELMDKADMLLKNSIDKNNDNKSNVFEDRYEWYSNKIAHMLHNIKNVDTEYIAKDYLRVIKYILDIYYN